MKRTKRDKRDALFSKMIRRRDRFTCQRCSAKHEESSTGLHCSHHFTRSRRRTRWTPLNAVALCFSCHNWYGGNPDESSVWLSEYLGAERLEELRRMQTETIKASKPVKEEIYRVLKEDAAFQEKHGPDVGLRDPVAQLRAEGLL